jgi:hypothetical protein
MQKARTGGEGVRSTVSRRALLLTRPRRASRKDGGFVGPLNTHIVHLRQQWESRRDWLEKGGIEMKNKGMAQGIAVGVAIGCALGVVMHNIAVGIGIGVAIGAGIGAGLSAKQKDAEDKSDKPDAES